MAIVGDVHTLSLALARVSKLSRAMAQAGPSPRAPARPARRMPASRGARPSSSAPTALPPATPRAPRHGRPPCWASPTRAQSSGGAAQGDASDAVRGASRRRARARPPVLPARSAPRARMTLAAPGWGPCTPPFECSCLARAARCARRPREQTPAGAPLWGGGHAANAAPGIKPGAGRTTRWRAAAGGGGRLGERVARSARLLRVASRALQARVLARLRRVAAREEARCASHAGPSSGQGSPGNVRSEKS